MDKPKIKLDLDDEAKKELYQGSLIEGIRAIRYQLRLGLKETKEVVERIRRGEIEVETGKPSNPCPYCKGSGVAQGTTISRNETLEEAAKVIEGGADFIHDDFDARKRALMAVAKKIREMKS